MGKGAERVEGSAGTWRFARVLGVHRACKDEISAEMRVRWSASIDATIWPSSAPSPAPWIQK
jgi:hypothetical protein